MRFIYTLLVTLSLAACASTSYQKYEQPTEAPLVRLEVNDQVHLMSFMRQESKGFMQGLGKVMNAVNSTTLWGVNAGILSVNGQYIDGPGRVYKYVTVKPGETQIKVAAFLGGDSGNLYDTVEYDFKAGKTYLVTIAANGPASIGATISETISEK